MRPLNYSLSITDKYGKILLVLTYLEKKENVVLVRKRIRTKAKCGLAYVSEFEGKSVKQCVIADEMRGSQNVK
jgi:hypothetical protein